MSDANRVAIRYARYSGRSFPAPVAQVASLRALRITGTPNLGFAPNTVQSAEIRADRQVSDLILVGAQASGDVAFELSYGTFDDIMESAMLSSWVESRKASGEAGITALSGDANNSTFTVNSATGFKVGQIVRFSGLDAVGDGVFQITGIAGAVLTCVPITTGTKNVPSGTQKNAAFSLKVCGARTVADGDLASTINAGVMTLTVKTAGFFTNIMGDGQGLVPGQWVKLSGFSTAANNAWVRLKTVSALALTFDAPSSAAAETPAGRVAIYFGDYVRNGAEALTEHQFLLERRYEDHKPVSREVFLGMLPNVLALNYQSQSVATGSVSWFGQSAKIATAIAELFSGGTPVDVAAPKTQVLNTAANVARLGVGGVQADAGGKNYVLGLTMQVSNNARGQGAIRHVGNVRAGTGAMVATGNINTYFDSLEYLQDVFNNAEKSVDIILKDATGRTMIQDLPRIKFSGGVPQVTGQNTDVLLPLPYQALEHRTLGYTMHIQRFEFAA